MAQVTRPAQPWHDRYHNCNQLLWLVWLKTVTEDDCNFYDRPCYCKRSWERVIMTRSVTDRHPDFLRGYWHVGQEPIRVSWAVHKCVEIWITCGSHLKTGKSVCCRLSPTSASKANSYTILWIQFCLTVNFSPSKVTIERDRWQFFYYRRVFCTLELESLDDQKNGLLPISFTRSSYKVSFVKESALNRRKSAPKKKWTVFYHPSRRVSHLRSVKLGEVSKIGLLPTGVRIGTPSKVNSHSILTTHPQLHARINLWLSKPSPIQIRGIKQSSITDRGLFHILEDEKTVLLPANSVSASPQKHRSQDPYTYSAPCKN